MDFYTYCRNFIVYLCIFVGINLCVCVCVSVFAHNQNAYFLLSSRKYMGAKRGQNFSWNNSFCGNNSCVKT